MSIAAILAPQFQADALYIDFGTCKERAVLRIFFGGITQAVELTTKTLRLLNGRTASSTRRMRAYLRTGAGLLTCQMNLVSGKSTSSHFSRRAASGRFPAPEVSSLCGPTTGRTSFTWRPTRCQSPYTRANLWIPVPPQNLADS